MIPPCRRVCRLLALLACVVLAASCASAPIIIKITFAPSPRSTATFTIPPTLIPAVTPSPAPTPLNTPSAALTLAPSPTPVATPTLGPSPTPVAIPTLGPPAPSAIPNLTYHVPILMYHRIVPDAEARQVLNGLLVTPEVFSAELLALHDDGWTTITLGQLAQDMQDGSKPPAKTFVLTFDDGWWDGFAYAAPIMAQYGFVGTFFVISSRGAPDFLSPAQMVSLEAAGNEIGDHSVSHYALAGHTYSVDYNQICAAADAIAANLGHRPSSLAYPIGPYDGTTMAAAAACPGIKIAVSTVEGAAQSWQTRYATPRVRISRSSRAPGVLAYLKRLTGQ